MSKHVLSILLLLLACIQLSAQVLCKDTKVSVTVDTSQRKTPWSIRTDSMLKVQGITYLHIREDIYGEYRLSLNGNVFFEGMIKGDPRLGYHPEVFELHTIDGDNVLTMEETKTGYFVKMRFNTPYRQLSIERGKACEIRLVTTYKMPFRG